MKKIVLLSLCLLGAAVARAGNPYANNADLPDSSVVINFDIYDTSYTVPSTGIKPVYQVVPNDMTVDTWELVADSSGSASVAVDSSWFSTFPPATSVLAATCTLTTNQTASGSTASWASSTLYKGMWLAPNLISVGTVKRVRLALKGHRI